MCRWNAKVSGVFKKTEPKILQIISSWGIDDHQTPCGNEETIRRQRQTVTLLTGKQMSADVTVTFL